MITEIARLFARIQGYEDLGLFEDCRRELEALPPALRELPEIQLRLGRTLEHLSQFDDALALYGNMEPSTLSRLGRVRCLAKMGRGADARGLLDSMVFDAAAVKEFVEARDLVR
jgi:hypothetical protein